jgi:hypothetical protein
MGGQMLLMKQEYLIGNFLTIALILLSKFSWIGFLKIRKNNKLSKT